MAVELPAFKTRVKYLGMFNSKELYRNTREWLADKGYVKPENIKYLEKYYSEKRSSDPREGTTIWIWWRTKKGEEKSSYYEMHMDIDFHFRFVKDIEVMVEGKKMKVQQGEIEVMLNSYLVLDPDDKWENHWLLKNFHELFYKRIWRKQRESRRGTIIGDCAYIQDKIKEFMEISRFGPKGEAFYLKYGYIPRETAKPL